MTECHLTFDIDWAPDWSVRETLRILERHDAPATFFVTHESDVVDEIVHAGHRVGIHPNFMSGSSHGDSPIEVVAHLLEICPDASVMRTHGLHDGTILFRDVITEFPQITHDLSTLTFAFEHVGLFPWHAAGARMTRINYNWEDDIAFDAVDFQWDRFIPFGPLSVLDFHPIHISLNSSTSDIYDLVKSELDAPLHSADENVVTSRRSTVPGTADYLHAVLESGVKLLTFDELICK